VTCPKYPEKFIRDVVKGMYRSVNALFRKVGRVASPDVAVHLVKTWCLPVLDYAIEACPTNKSDICPFAPLSTSLILASEKYSMWNRMRLCTNHTNVKLSSGCSQSLTLLTVVKVNFSWIMTIPITCLASCTKNCNEIVWHIVSEFIV